MFQLPGIRPLVYWLPQEAEVWPEGTWMTDWTEPDHPEWFRKCLAQRQVSPSGKKEGADMVEIDLSKLLGRQGFHVDSQLAYNGLSFTVNTLADTRANGYFFIDMKKAIKLAHFYNIPTEPLRQPVKIRGFSGSDRLHITHTIKLHLIVGGQWFLNQTFLILNLGQHKAIISRQWFAEHDV